MMHNAHGASTRSKQHAKFGGGAFPPALAIAHGAYVWGTRPNRYTDWIAALGAVVLGYQQRDVAEALRFQVTSGMLSSSMPSVDEERVAAHLCAFLGWPEQVRWINSGSEATAGAMLIARRATGRRLIYSVGYHGWHETHVVDPALRHTEEQTETALDSLNYGQPVKEWVPRIPQESYAAVIIECGRDEHPTDGYLKWWRGWCDASGALLIADEVWAGLRLARGGWSERYGIRPDLACFSKALGNGVPVAAIVGSEALMQYAHHVSSTFGGNGLGLAAASAVMHVYEKEPILERLHAIGERLLKECPTLLCGVPARPHFRDPERAVAITQHCAARGHLVHPAGITPMYAHTDADVEALIAALNEFSP